MTDSDNHAEQAGDVLRIPLAEETLKATITQRQTGVVRFTKHVDVEPLSLEIDLQSDHLEIERTSSDEVVQAPHDPWYEGDTLVIPVYEERLVTEKRLVLTELIRVRRQATTETVRVEDTVRKERVEVETIPTAPDADP